MRRSPLIATVALAALLAAGCGGGDPKSDPPRTPTSPTLSPAPSTSAPADPTPPPMPALARRHTVRGAAAFVRFYFQVLNYAQSTLDTSLLDSLDTGLCDGCQGAIDNLKAIRKRHGTVHGGEETIQHIAVNRMRAGDLRPFEVLVKSRASRQVIRYGPGELKRFSGGRASYRVVLYQSDNGWQVGTLEIE